MGTRMTSGRKAFGALAVVTALIAAVGGRASGTQAAIEQTCDASSYRLALRSATDPPRADLTIRVTAVVPECELPETLTSVQVTIFALNGSVQRTLALENVASPGGAALVQLGRIARRQRVQANVTFGPQITLSGATRTTLRPDLALTSVKTNRVSLTGRPFFVVANVRELNADVGGVTAGGPVTAPGGPVGTGHLANSPPGRGSVKNPA